MGLLIELLMALAGEAVAEASEPLATRVYRELKRRLRLWHVFVSWVTVVALMVTAWHLGLASNKEWFRWVTGLVFVLGPVPAMVISAAWSERYDYRADEAGPAYSTRERVLFSLLIPPTLAATAVCVCGVVGDPGYLLMWFALCGGVVAAGVCLKIVVTGRSWRALDRRS